MSHARPILDDELFEALPVDPNAGLPQSFSKLYGGQILHFRLYANLSADRLDAKEAFLDLSREDGALVVRVERELSGGARELVLLRRVLPGLVYETPSLRLTFGPPRLARSNLNGRGPAGTQLSGGIGDPMGVIIEYLVKLPDQSISASNHVFKGEWIVDAEISVEMICGWPGTGFEIKFFDLPVKELEKIQVALDKKKPVPVEVKLGYFDGKFDKVLDGLVDKMSVKADGAKIVAKLTGLETGTAALTRARVDRALPRDTEIAQAIRDLLQQATFPAGEISRTPQIEGITGKLKDGIRTGKLLAVLDSLARAAGGELMSVDQQLWVGKPVVRNDYLPPPSWHPDEDLAGFEPFSKEIPSEISRYHFKEVPAASAQGFRFLIAGDPRLRPGQKVLAQVDGYNALAGAEFRVASLVHRFSPTAGYVCEGFALKRSTGDDASRQAEASTRPSAADLARKLSQRVDQGLENRPFVEIGEVKQAHPAASSTSAPHRATLYYGQQIPPTETQPSLRTAVTHDEEQLFREKPLASPFAWHKCGLIVPVYQGMRAVVLHNLGRGEDPLVAGFTWSEQPAIEPPAAVEGDWWLCLPLDLSGDAAPSASTKAANDLTAKDGRRVIEAKGLKIVLGSSKLASVGTRPTEGAADELLIEHSSGTQVQIDSSGNVKIKAAKVSIEGDLELQGAFKQTGDATITGNVEIQ